MSCMLPISICFTASGFGKRISITLLDLHTDFIAHSSLIILGSCLFLACKWQNGCQLDMHCTVYEVIQFKSCWTDWLRRIEGKYIFLPQKIILLKSLHVISIISPISWSGSCFWLLSSLSSPSLLCVVELASIMTESSHYYQHTCWLMYGIDLHVLPRAYEACVEVMFAGHYHTCCWRSLEMLVAFPVIQTTLSSSQSHVSSFSCLLICC